MDKLISEKLLDIKNNSTKKYWNISWKLGEELSKIVHISKCNNILEIGTSNGFSSLWMAKSMDKFCKILTIDVNKERCDEAKINFKYCKLENKIKQTTGEIVKLLENNQIEGKFDFLFLDAAQKSYLKIIRLLEEKNFFTKDITIVADNILTHDNMLEFLDYMDKHYSCKLLKIDSGFLIAKSKI